MKEKESNGDFSVTFRVFFFFKGTTWECHIQCKPLCHILFFFYKNISNENENFFTRKYFALFFIIFQDMTMDFSCK